MDNKWRFPPANGGQGTGMSSGDKETFKGSPSRYFARELLQNSIDAIHSDEEPVRVIIQRFNIPASKIPGRGDLKEAAKNVKEFFNDNPEYKKTYDRIIKMLDSDSVPCLRVSEFNTTGLIGIESFENTGGNQAFSLIKGSGITTKNRNEGGSKGVGKNAIFLMSELKLVFFSTYAERGLNDDSTHKGYIGVANYESGRIPNTRGYTQGNGYFASGSESDPIEGEFQLDPSFRRNYEAGEFGTDIYILGFIEDSGWDREVINSILDSYMAAIVRGKLVIDLDGLEISKATIAEILDSDRYIYPKYRANLISQYRLLTGYDGVQSVDIDTEFGSVELFILPIKSSEADLATHNCSIIRHPLMKIKDFLVGKTFQVSALAIIPEGRLGETLRAIENPSHDGWAPNRKPKLKSLLSGLIQKMESDIKSAVIKALGIDENQAIDPYGAGDYLPDIQEGETEARKSIKDLKGDEVTVTKMRRNESFGKSKAYQEGNSDGIVPEIGSVDETNNDDAVFPEGTNDGSGGPVRPGPGEGIINEGENDIPRHSKTLGSVRYRLMCLDKTNGRMKCTFVAPVDSQECYFSVNLLDDVNGREKLNVRNLKVNGQEISGALGRDAGPFPIKKGSKVSIEYTTNMVGYYGSEVIIKCK